MKAVALQIERHRRERFRKWLLVGGLGFGCLLSLFLALAVGPSDVSLGDVMAVFMGQGERTASVILWQLRLPMAVLALLAGAALGLAGAEMQTILNNPLAEPYTIGVSSSAALGAALAIVLDISLPGFGIWAVPANAFLFAFGALLLVQFLSDLRGAGTDMLVLFGIGIGLTATALLSLIQYVASADALQSLVFWMMGSLTRADFPSLAVLTGVQLIAVPWSLLSASNLMALRLGEDRAHAMGVTVSRVRLFSLLRVSLLAGTAVAFVGIIGFVGLIAPHIARLCVGEDHRLLLPASCLTGALILSLAGSVSTLIVPGVVLPIGIVTALVGLPVFFAVILRRIRS